MKSKYVIMFVKFLLFSSQCKQGSKILYIFRTTYNFEHIFSSKTINAKKDKCI